MKQGRFINNVAQTRAFCYGDEFQEYEWKGVDKDVMFYLYRQGSYNGDGYGISIKDGQYSLWSFSHCSCYGPTENSPIIYSCANAEEIITELKKHLNSSESYEELIKDFQVFIS